MSLTHTGTAVVLPPPSTGPAVYRALAAVSAELAQHGGVGKTRRNEVQGYQFRGIDEVMNAVAPLLGKHRLLILPRMVNRSVTERATKTGTMLFSVVVDAEFDCVSVEDGSHHLIRTYGEAMDSGDKATNKAMSAAYKYALCQALCIPLEGLGQDADTVTHEIAAPKPATTRPAPMSAPVRSPASLGNSPQARPVAPSAAEKGRADTRPITTMNQDGTGKGQLGRLIALCASRGRTDAEVKAYLLSQFGLKSRSQIQRKDYDAICEAIQAPGPLPGTTPEPDEADQREPGADG